MGKKLEPLPPTWCNDRVGSCAVTGCLPYDNTLKDPMRFIIRYSLPVFFAVVAVVAHADDWNQYRMKGNLFSDYRPAHQRANPGAEWDRIKANEQRQINREFEQRHNRNRSDGGRIDNRDYSRQSRQRDDRMRYHSADPNRHRNSGRIDNNTYGATPSPAPSARQTQRWVGPDYSAQQKNAWRTPAQTTPPARQARSLYTPDQPDNKPEKYYGTRSGESLYPYTAKPVKDSLADDTASHKTSQTSRQAARALYGAASPRDPSYGGNKAWGTSSDTRVDTRRFYQDEISKYRKEHKPRAYCSDGSISGKGSGACSGHGGLLKRNQDS